MAATLLSAGCVDDCVLNCNEPTIDQPKSGAPTTTTLEPTTPPPERCFAICDNSTMFNAGNSISIDRANAKLLVVDGLDIWPFDNLTCSGSMKPVFDCGDVLLLKLPVVSELAVGEIIGYQVPDALLEQCHGPGSNFTTIHRISRAYAADGETTFQTRGDANQGPDACAVPFSWVQYRVVGVIYGARAN